MSAVNTAAPLADTNKSIFVTCNTSLFSIFPILLSALFCNLHSALLLVQNFYYTNTLERNTMNAVNTVAAPADPNKSIFVNCNTSLFSMFPIPLSALFCNLHSALLLVQNFYYTNTLERNTMNAVNAVAAPADPNKSIFVSCNTSLFSMLPILPSIHNFIFIWYCPFYCLHKVSIILKR